MHYSRRMREAGIKKALQKIRRLLLFGWLSCSSHLLSGAQNYIMSVDAKAEIHIQKPREEVAAVMFNPKCDKLWIGGLVNVFPLTPGLLVKGAKVERVGDFLSRRYSAMVLVMKDEPNKFVELSANEPFEMKVRYDLADSDGGTTAKVRIQSIGESVYQLPASLFNKAVLEAITEDLKRLKKHVETQES